MSPEEQARRAFCDDMLVVLRTAFYPKPEDSKKFFRDRTFLLRAITQPAAYLHKRGARLPASHYRRILLTVVDTIKRKGNVGEIGYFPRYLLHCVQTHMEHNGERYYYAAKGADGRPAPAMRPAAEVVATALKALGRAGQGDQTTPILAGVNQALTVRGRIRKGKKTATEMELPGLCNRRAKAPK